MTARAVDQLVETLRANGKDVNPEKGKIDGYWGQCPVPTHGRGRGDLHPSLHITGVEGRVLIHCILRCARADVLAAIGWTEADLFDQKTTIYRYDDGRKVKRWYDNGKRQFAQSDHKEKKPTLYRLAKVKQLDRPRLAFRIIVEEHDDLTAV